MGKRQHQKDKMYLTYTEWTTLYGGKASGTSTNTHEDSTFRRLPFDHCCLSLQPFEHPYCDTDGNIFDLEALLPYVKHYKHNPVTGKPIDPKSLTKLNFFKNADGDYHCPVLFKPFLKHSHIVAIKTTGNVFSYEAIEQLNIKSRHWKDLITDEPFTRKDIITIQDPSNARKFNLSTFHHIKHNLRVEDEEITKERKDPNAKLKTVSSTAKDVLIELEKTYKPAEQEKLKVAEKADKFNAAPYSTGAAAAGFTSTVMPVVRTTDAAILDEDVVRYERVKKKGYVKLVTNLGPLNLELHCDLVPKTCENFLKHCKNGYYNGTKFHRSIKNFMIQGGDPTNTGKGGTSIWGKPFEDEFKPNLVHQGRGILSMANSGTDTNGSQFFITFRSCRHLDNKHTVFGKIVGGLETLNELEKIEVDNKDRPIEDIIIQIAQIYVDPYEEVDEQLAKDRAEDLEKQAKEAAEKNKSKIKEKDNVLKVYRPGVGKYVNPTKDQSKVEPSTSTNSEVPAKKSKIVRTDFSFSSW
ncbi:hypothetical protein TKK_0017433 [Trichogramma kaykai]|uniref:RING-type E3 ubiquitin-protein ligase PPIL2 n=1 Tax=Trichogramma kaykai TaxID=54128 RepID=A0ABD2W348_9HYME